MNISKLFVVLCFYFMCSSVKAMDENLFTITANSNQDLVRQMPRQVRCLKLNNNVNGIGLSRAVRDYPEIEDLDISGCFSIGFNDLGQIGQFKNLRKLSIDCRSDYDFGASDVIERIVSGCPLIEDLDLWFRRYYSPDDFRHIGRLPKLKRLRLGHIDINREALDAITRGCPCLTELAIYHTSQGNSLNPDDFKLIARLHGLNTLWLDDTKIGDEGLKEIIASKQGKPLV